MADFKMPQPKTDAFLASSDLARNQQGSSQNADTDRIQRSKARRQDASGTSDWKRRRSRTRKVMVSAAAIVYCGEAQISREDR